LNRIRETKREQKGNSMKTQIGAVTFALLLCAAVQVRSADAPDRSEGQTAGEDALQLIKDRDEALPKAKAAEQELRNAGASPIIEFESAKALRDKEAASGSKFLAYDRYAKSAKRIEKKIQEDVYHGDKSSIATNIARFEHLQAEVDLARVAGRLPAKQE
jgi:hypothetical protein